MQDEQARDIDDIDQEDNDNIFMNGGKYVARYEDDTTIQKY